jgi:parallel beta-helix repeat protein
LTPGFYVVEIVSAAGSPRGTFQMGLDALGFSGGVVVGGFITEGLTGFGAFCVPQSQNVDMRLLGNTEYGAAAAGDLILTLRDAGRNVIATVNTSIPLAEPVAPPPAPDISGLTVRWYVDASASANGNGSAASPYRSITQALTQAQAGQVVFVRPGRYSPSSTGEILPMNRARAGVRLIGAGAADTIIDGERVNENAVVIAAANVRMAGFTIRNAGQAGLFVFRSNNVVVENNLFTSNVRFGVGSLESRGLIVRNNVSVSNLESGMAFSGSTPQAVDNAPANCPASPAGAYGAYVVNNVASDNRADGILVTQGGNVCVADNVTRTNGSSGIEFNNRAEGAALPALNGTIVNNEIIGNGGVQFGFAGTGILVTEGARGDLIQGNSLLNNRPFGIGIFLNGEAGRISNNTVLDTSAQGILVQRGSHANEISDNTIRNSGASALFVENDGDVDLIARNAAAGNGIGLSVLEGSSVVTVDQNVLDRNGVGMEVVSSGVTTVRNNSFQGSSTGGVFVRQSSTIGSFNDNHVRNNRGQGGMLVDASTVTVNGGEFSGNGGGGMSLFANANVTIRNAHLDSNQAPGGLFLVTGAKATLTGVTLNGNIQQGVLAADAGTSVTLAGGNSVTSTQGIGLNAQNGASITCSGSNTLSGNSGGDTLGPVAGCQ